MSFERVIPRKQTVSKSIAVTVAVHAGKKGKRPRFQVSISRAAAEHRGFLVGTNFIMSVGKGEDFGKIAVMRADEDEPGYKLSPSGNRLTVTSGSTAIIAIPEAGKEIETIPARGVEVSWTNSGFVLFLPPDIRDLLPTEYRPKARAV